MNVNPVFITFGSIIVANIVAIMASHLPLLFNGVTPELQNGVANAIVVSVALWIHGKVEVKQAERRADG